MLRHHVCLFWLPSAVRTLLCVCAAGSQQSKEVVFPRSTSPSFLTVPGEGFAEPFALTPGKWIVHIRAQGILLVSSDMWNLLQNKSSKSVKRRLSPRPLRIIWCCCPRTTTRRRCCDRGSLSPAPTCPLQTGTQSRKTFISDVFTV